MLLLPGHITAYRKFNKFNPGKTSTVFYLTHQYWCNEYSSGDDAGTWWWVALDTAFQIDPMSCTYKLIVWYINILPFQPRWGWFVQRISAVQLQLVAPKRVCATWVIIRTNLCFPSTFKRLKGLSAPFFFYPPYAIRVHREAAFYTFFM